MFALSELCHPEDVRGTIEASDLDLWKFSFPSSGFAAITNNNIVRPNIGSNASFSQLFEKTVYEQ